MKVLINGKIYTEDTRKPWAEAVAIEGKDFVCVGTNAEVIAYAKFNAAEYETVDLGGKTVLPGIIDGHNHPALISVSSWMVYAPRIIDKDELAANILKEAKKHPKEEMPYFVYNVYYGETFGEEGPHKSFLDALISDRPARLNDDGGHGCLYNSMALEMLKDENGVPHSASPIGGQEFYKDANGDYTGYAFQTFAVGDKGVFEAIGWKPDSCMSEKASEGILSKMHHYGAIGYMEAAFNGEGDLEYLARADKAGELNYYVDAAIMLQSMETVDQTVAMIRDFRKKYTTEHIFFNTVKFFGDGSAEAGDVLSLVPFSNDPEGKNYGRCNFTFEQMRDVLVRLNKERLDFHMHTICDGTLRRMLDAVEAAQQICGDDWCIRVTLAHLEVMHPDDEKRFKKLGVYADLTPHWFAIDAPKKTMYIGEERAARSWDYSQFLKDGVDVNFSSDNTSFTDAVRTSLFIGFQVAMTGIEPGIGGLEPTDLNKYPNGRLPESGKWTVEQCIHAATYAGAKRMRILDKIGSIEVGKKACLVVLDKDIFTIPANEVSTIEPECIYFDGKELRIPDLMKD